MNEITELKMVEGNSIPLPSGLSGIQGWSARTRYPKMNRTTLNMSRAPVYCFQSCGPLSRRLSHQPSTGKGRYFPSIIHAR